MLRARSSRWKPVSLLAGLLLTLVLPLLLVTSAAAATSCTWTDQSDITCNGETFSSPTIKGTTMTLSGRAAGESSTCAADTLTVANYEDATSAKETAYTGIATGKFSRACSSTTSTVTLSNTYTAVGQAATSSSCTTEENGDCASSTDDSLSCGSGLLSWIVCPVINLAVAAANRLDIFIMNSLDVDVSAIFDNVGKTCGDAPCASTGYYSAWNSFRILAEAILVIGGLIMVSAQALGFEALDAYTVRKVLPRLLVAVIGIALSWPLMRLVVYFFDTVGLDLRSIMYYPFRNFGGTLSVSGGLLTSTALVAGLFAMGPAALTLILTALLAVFVGFLVIVIRQVAIVMLIVVAPVAIACYILPNTQRLWKLWYDNFLGLMLMFPIISGLIAAGHIYAAVALRPNGSTGSTGSLFAQATAIIAYFAPYFMLPMAARMATGIIGNIAGFVNDRHRGAFDRLKGVRQQAMADRHKERMEGKTRFGSSKAGGVYRRAALMGRDSSWSPTAQGRAKYGQHEIMRREALAAEALKNDNGRAANDDIGNYVAKQRDTTGRNFVQRYAQRELATDTTGQLTLAQAEEHGRRAMGLLETGYGARMGSDLMRVAAFKGEQMATTGYGDTDEEVARRFNDAHQVVADGLMNASDAMATIKQNKARVEASGVSFGAGIGAIQRGNITNTDVQSLMDTTLEGLTPQSLIGARRESATLIARHLQRHLEQTVNRAGGNLNDDSVKRFMGQIAGVQDTINAQAPQMANVFADNLFAQHIGNTNIRIRDYSDSLRAGGDAAFNDVRKEWLGGVPPGTPPGAGGAPGAGTP